ncbi:MAG: response regulator [Candidatus Marinimicrobia bacterium]|jgi:DNA-binding response OmpR family regulator|nr:response regulator [Candidatus Neomarinimicrobiota bacterium]MBT3576220.1 response regulator [Candidatus Neomarinimicrobiota bacterium]MBT3679508.1 response regulator [Candidatus Neomarinimicrobiota bacterium]MBT4130698.1 response regulator [Candidatus Neomarinimicrobiota bacterium]MBT4296490.1 response regulator [Candidatus Neomarinimicrobiota bacterium]
MMAKKRILIVDDEKFFIEPVKRLLESLDYEVFEALDGISGLSKAREVNPDLIMLDLMLPGMNGYQVCRLLKFDEQFRDIPVIIVSAKDGERDREVGTQSGAELYLVKPLNYQTFPAELEALL